MIVEELKKLDPKNTQKFLTKFANFKPCIIMNMIDDPKDVQKSVKIRRSVKQYLNTDMEHLGVIYKDSLQDVALSSRLPVIIYKPQSMISQAIYRIADKVMESESQNYIGNDFVEFADTTFMEAELEAETDFKTKIGYVDELIGGDSLSKGDMAELIKSQQFEITNLRSENMLLKSKISKAIKAGFKL